MRYKVRKMTIWQKLYVMDIHTKFQDNPFTVLGAVLRHGIKEWDGLDLKEMDITLPDGHKCKVLTDESLAKLIDLNGVDINKWNDVLTDIYRENAFPFFKDTSDGGQK